MTFTEARVEQARRLVCDGELPADSTGRRSWRDEGCRGLVLVVNQRSGSAVLYFQGTVNGQTVRRAIGDTETVRLDEARKAVGRLRYDRSAAGVLAPRPAASADSLTVGSVVAEMLDAHAAGRWLPGTRSRTPLPRTMKFYRDLRKSRLTPHEKLTLEQFAAKLPAIYGGMKAEAPIQANRFVQLVRNLFAYAADAGAWKSANPTAATSKTERLTRTVEVPRTRILTDAEWDRLKKAMRAEGPLWHDLFTVSLTTLQRMGACRNMRWKDLILTGSRAEWRIPAEYMKGRKPHAVPLADMPDALAVLRQRRKLVPKNCDYVFPKGDGSPVVYYDKEWARILVRAKLWVEDRRERPRPHDLRRTGGATMTAAGAPLQTVTRALGNSPSSAGMVAKTYAMVTDEALRDAFKATAARRSKR